MLADKQEKDPVNGPFEAYGGGKSWDKWGKKFYHNLPLSTEDAFHVAVVTPVIHYCMGGLKIDEDSQVLGSGDKVIGGLYCGGEAAGGVHGSNRLGGNSLLDCVVFGRVSGRRLQDTSQLQTSNSLRSLERLQLPSYDLLMLDCPVEKCFNDL